MPCRSGRALSQNTTRSIVSGRHEIISGRSGFVPGFFFVLSDAPRTGLFGYLCWKLPIGGQAHFDGGLGVWIGLHHRG